MLKSCQYCGRIHKYGFNCPYRPQKAKKETDAYKFRSSAKWQKKRKEIKERDYHLCQICLRGLYVETGPAINYKDTQVHHIIPIAEDWEKRMDNDNLITLCPIHHEMAECEKIPRSVLMEISQEQEASPGRSGNRMLHSCNTNSAHPETIKSQNESW